MGYITPQTLSDALQALRDGDGGVRVVAGCTDYFPQRANARPDSDLLDITRLPGLRGVSRGVDGWQIGAATTWSDVINADLPPAFDGLKLAAREVGSVQIQNAGTVAGNLCNASPAADGVPPLLTLEASLELRSLGGTRRVPVSHFITGVRRIDLRPDEMVVAIHIPDQPDQTRSHFLKLGARRYLVISIAMVSVLLALDGAGRIEWARVAVGSCSAVAQRLGGLEDALAGQGAGQLRADPGIWTRHLAPLSPLDDVRGSAEFRLEVAGELCRRAVLGAMEGRDG